MFLLYVVDYLRTLEGVAIIEGCLGLQSKRVRADCDAFTVLLPLCVQAPMCACF